MAKVEKRTPTLSKGRQRELLREMLLIRRFEEKVEERFRAGELPGFLHVAIGTTPNEIMAELYWKLEGCSHGYGGSMHLYDVERGFLGANAVVGG
ncbi:MAG TPA: hypothetical protein VG073_07170, partial [Gaiellaceae bacterium]|nr:hypothetical protein [Gaiellaceae bacterium]